MDRKVFLWKQNRLNSNYMNDMGYKVEMAPEKQRHTRVTLWKCGNVNLLPNTKELSSLV